MGSLIWIANLPPAPVWAVEVLQRAKTGTRSPDLRPAVENGIPIPTEEELVQWGVPSEWRYWIVNGPPPKRPEWRNDRSRFIAAVVGKLFELGVPRLEVVGVLLHPTWAIGEKVREKSNPVQWACQEVERLHRKGKRVVPLRRPKELVTLPDLQARLKVAVEEILEHRSAGMYLVDAALGTGKTTTVAKTLHERRPGKTLFLSPTHSQARQVQDIFGDSAVTLKSRQQLAKDGQLDCPRLAEIQEALARGLPVRERFCFNRKHPCPRYKDPAQECPYFKQYQEAEEKQVVIAMHDHLPSGIAKQDEWDVIVVDECFFPEFRKEVYYTKTDIEYTERILDAAALMAGDAIKRGEYGAQTVDRYIHYLKANVRLLRGSGPPVRLPSLGAKSKKLFQRILYDAIDSVERTLGDQRPRLLLDNILELVTMDKPPQVRQTAGGWAYIRTAALPKDKPIIVLDATITAPDLQAVRGDDYPVVEVRACQVAVKQQVRVIQYTGGRYCRTTLEKQIDEDPARWLTIIQTIARGRDVAVISHKFVIEKLRLEKRLGPDRVGWFGNLRGENRFADAEVLIVIGTPELSDNDLVAQARIHHGRDWDDAVEVGQVRKDTQSKDVRGSVYMMDGRVEWVRTRRFSNPDVQRTWDYAVRAELEQAVGRARIYSPSDKPREVHIIAEVPLRGIRVDELRSLEQLRAEIQVRVDPRRRRSEEQIGQVIDYLLAEGWTASEIKPKLILDTAPSLGLQLKRRSVERLYRAVLERRLGAVLSAEKGSV